MKAVLVVASLLLVACGDTDGPTDPITGDLNGAWTFEQVVANQTEAVACVLRGSVQLTQNGSAVSGHANLDESMCTYLIDGGAPGGPVFGEAPIDFGSILAEGTVSADSFAIRSESCSYQGTLSGHPVARIEGTVQCTLTIDGEYDEVPVHGTWSAVR